MDGKGTASGSAPGDQERQSDRIRYAYRLNIAGKDSSDISFNESSRTEIITRDGGLIVTGLSLATGHVIKLTRGEKSRGARIIGQVGIRGDEFLYGVQFVDPSADAFWDVHFPATNPDGSAGKSVLQCTKCTRQELLHLSEIEMVVFESMRVIPHHCPQCVLETLWSEPSIVGDNALVSRSEAYNLTETPAARRQRTVNDRKHGRVQMRNIKACVHRPGFEDDIVTVTNLSRGGIGFTSPINYFAGTRIEVAVPYTEGAANVFTPAKIVRVRCRPTADIPGEFGLEYVKR
jgi:hypothetical protein